MSIAERLGVLYTRLSGILSACNTALTGKGAETVTQLDGIADAIAGISSGTDTSDATAAAADVRQGKTFYAGGKKTGSMADAAVKTSVASVDSDGYVTVYLTLSEGFAAEDTTLTGGTQLSTQAAQTITPGRQAQTIETGKYLTGPQTIEGDANLLSPNIKQGVSIFGVPGTLSGGAKAGSFAGDNTNAVTLEAGFEPAYLIIASTKNYTSMGSGNYYMLVELTADSAGARGLYARNPGSAWQFNTSAPTVSFSGSGAAVTLPSSYRFASGTTYYWAAWA